MTVPPSDPAGRDRDIAGRPRNARPRDELGRPLPRSAAGTPAMPEEASLTPGQAAELADELLRTDRPFHAHEVLEAAWKAAPEAERDLWQGLAQIAVGITHARRGNATGAVALLRRGADRVRRYRGSGVPYGMDIERALELTDALAGRVQRAGLSGLTPDDFRLPLR